MPRKLGTYGVAAAVGLVVFIIVLGFHVATRSDQLLRYNTQFNQNANLAHDIVSENLLDVQNALQHLSAAVSRAKRDGASETAAFHNFANDITLLARYPELSALGLMQYGTPETLDAMIQDANRDNDRAAIGYPPLENRFDWGDAHLVLFAISPLTGGREQLGLDILATSRGEVFERVQTYQRLQASPIFQSFTDEPSVAFFQPHGADLETGQINAIIASIFTPNVFLDRINTSLAPLAIDIELHDFANDAMPDDVFTSQTLLGSSLTAVPSTPPDIFANAPGVISRPISIGGRDWRLVMRSTIPLPTFWSGSRILILGAVIAFMTSIIVFKRLNTETVLASRVAVRTSDLRDIADMLETERAKALYDAHHDELTDLLNRRGLQNAYQDIQADHRQDTRIAAVAIDIRNFKEINDVCGYAAGDRLLQYLGENLTRIAPQGACVSRLGSDEFVVIYDRSIPRDPVKLAEQIMALSHQPLETDDDHFRYSLRLSVMQTDAANVPLDLVLADLNIAMMATQSRGNTKIGVFTTQMRDQAVAQRILADDIRRGLDADEFEPFFQTQHDSETHALCGVEALIRWRHPTRGVLPPAAFLDTAETLGLIHEIDRRTMVKAVETVVELGNAGLHLPKINVNVSHDRLQDPDLQKTLDDLPDLQGQLCFEVVEAVFLDDLEDFEASALAAIRDHGIQIEIDDFGSGRASIIALTRLQPDRLKIDRELVMPLGSDPIHVQVLASIVDLARALDIGVTAEGVETQKHADILRDLGVDTLQGYLFGKPMSADDLRESLIDVAA